MTDKKEIRSEDSAEIVTVSGWSCKHCHRFYDDNEHMARYCCATTFPCECGKRRPKYYMVCDECRSRLNAERWYAKPEVVWDGSFPLGLWDDDKYFFNAEDLEDYIYDIEKDLETIEDLWLTSCEPNNGRHFEMSEFLQDDLCEESDLDDKKINATVNKWIADNAPFSWSMTGERLSIESVRKVLFDGNCET